MFGSVRFVKERFPNVHHSAGALRSSSVWTSRSNWFVFLARRFSLVLRARRRLSAQRGPVSQKGIIFCKLWEISGHFSAWGPSHRWRGLISVFETFWMFLKGFLSYPHTSGAAECVEFSANIYYRFSVSAEFLAFLYYLLCFSNNSRSVLQANMLMG